MTRRSGPSGGPLARPACGALHRRPSSTARRCESLRTEQIMTMVERDAVCTFDCPDTCSLTVTVEADRIVKVRGSQALPYTDAVICNKVAHHTDEFVHGARRLTVPLLRTGPRGSGRFERLSWERALDIIH
ncbi:MAG: hypothetical protein E6G96_20250, partial [Alphaproteobacteria bacterium]